MTALRLLEERPPVLVFMVPLLSIGIEVAFAADLVTTIGKTLRNTVRASSRLSGLRPSRSLHRAVTSISIFARRKGG